MSNLVRDAIASTLSMFLCATAGAVALNPRGTGQVLIYPYYTVNAGHGTLLSVVNTTDRGKALKVRFLEGYNGRDVLSFNLYLSPFDVWVAQVFAPDGPAGAAAVGTYDTSCTSSRIVVFPEFPAPSFNAMVFDDAAYTGANVDGGPTGPERTREGYVEVIEMGEVTNATHNTLDAITHGSNGVPSHCTQVVDAWAAGGYWVADPTIDLAPPTGGLYGSESIINVGEGTLYAVNAEVIDGFSNAVQHTKPGDAAPDLNTASKSADGTISAYVPIGGKLVKVDYASSPDAISALFMADNLYNEYITDGNVGAASEWIVTLPTKRFYTDKVLLGASEAKPPFDVVFSSANGGSSCVRIGLQIWNREEATIAGCSLLCTPVPSPALCYSTSSLRIGAAAALGSHLMIDNEIFTSRIDVATVGFTSGWLRTGLTNDANGNPQQRHALGSLNGITLLGEPAFGFLALDYVNGNVSPGVLSNYSGAYPHRVHVTCLTSTAPQSPCN